MPKQVHLVIPDVHRDRVTEATQGLFPIPVDEDTGEPLFTVDDWVNEKLRQTPVDWVHLWEKRQAGKAAVAAVVRDDGVIAHDVP